MSSETAIKSLAEVFKPEISALQKTQSDIKTWRQNAQSLLALKENPIDKDLNFGVLLQQSHTISVNIKKHVTTARDLLDQLISIEAAITNENLKIQGLKEHIANLLTNLNTQRQGLFLVQTNYKDQQTKTSEFRAYLSESLKLPEALSDTFKAQEQIIAILNTDVTRNLTEQEVRLTKQLTRLKQREAEIEVQKVFLAKYQLNSDEISKLIDQTETSGENIIQEAFNLEKAFREQTEQKKQEELKGYENELSELQKRLAKTESDAKTALTATEKERETKEKERDQLQKAITDLSQKRDQLAQTSQKKDELIQTLETQIKTAEEQSKSLKDQLGVLQKTQIETYKVLKRLQASETEFKKTSSNLTETERELTNIRQKLIKATEEVQNLKQSENQLKKLQLEKDATI